MSGPNGPLRANSKLFKGVLVFFCLSMVSTMLFLYSHVTFPYASTTGCPSFVYSMAEGIDIFCNQTGYFDIGSQRPVLLFAFYYNDSSSSSEKMLVCETAPSTLRGQSAVSLEVRSDQELAAANMDVLPGGRYRPKHCIQHLKVAVVVAYRDRKEHLQILLNNLHPFLQRQQLHYTIFVVEQAGNATFNRGMLFNVAYMEANKLQPFDCFVFHDVDLLPENDHNSYSCPQIPSLLSSAMDKFHYKGIYDDYFGGVVAFSSQDFQTINGYPNLYWGWGGEDDDIGARVRNQFRKSGKVSVDIGRYTMIKHGDDQGNPKNPKRFDLVNKASQRFKTDGLSSLSYTLMQIELRTLYTWILVDIGNPPNY